MPWDNDNNYFINSGSSSDHQQVRQEGYQAFFEHVQNGGSPNDEWRLNPYRQDQGWPHGAWKSGWQSAALDCQRQQREQPREQPRHQQFQQEQFPGQSYTPPRYGSGEPLNIPGYLTAIAIIYIVHLFVGYLRQ